MPTVDKPATTTRKPGAKRTIVPAAPDFSKLVDKDSNITVRNTLSTITVLVIKVDGNDEYIEFKPKGDPQGDDMAEVPSTYLKNSKFRKMLNLNVFEIIDADDSAILTAIDAQRAAYEETRRTQEEAAQDRLFNSSLPKAYSGVQCIEQEGRMQCSNLAVKGNGNERPPLCSNHSYLSGTYSPEETGKFADGKPVVAWRKVSIQHN